MNNFVGWTKEKLGRSTFKAVLLKPVAETERIYNLKTPEGKAYYPPKDAKTVKVWQAIKAHYFNPTDKLWKDKKMGSFELHLENVSYQRNEAKLLFIDAESGAPVSFDQLGAVTFTPQALTQVVGAEWVRMSVQAAKNLNVGWAIMAVLFGFGLVVGLLVGMNSGAISHAISPGPTPTPHIVLGGP